MLEVPGAGCRHPRRPFGKFKLVRDVLPKMVWCKTTRKLRMESPLVVGSYPSDGRLQHSEAAQMKRAAREGSAWQDFTKSDSENEFCLWLAEVYRELECWMRNRAARENFSHAEDITQ